MMNDEMNIHDEFEDWLKQSADKHRMYPSDKLWRNINEQLHEQPNWPALTFGAILTMALITATLVFLHPTKNVFTLPNYAYNATPSTSVKKADVVSPKKDIVTLARPAKLKEPVYAFNNDIVAAEPIASFEEYSADQSAAGSISPLASADENPVPETETLRSSTPRMNERKQEVLNNTELKITPATVKDLVAETAIAKEEVKEETNPLSEEEQLSDNSTAKTVRLPQAHKKRWHIEVYGGSNISYRRLRESMFDNHTATGLSVGSDRGSLNSMVSQKPAVGVNAGAAFVYAVSDRFRIKAGIQFNFRQYNIDAYKSSYERSVLLLNNGFYYPDSVYTYSAISNSQGKSIALTNRYYQIGIPVGVEWTAVKLPKVQFNLAANFQPTYQLNSNNYLLTSDYKSYVQAPGLLRHVNINAGVEATANFHAGNLQWQVGPQILYQTLPTQKNNYSIHEHLIDYGVRVGIIKRL